MLWNTETILYTIREVTSAFTSNDKAKNVVTAEKYQAGVSALLKCTYRTPKPRVVNVRTMMQI